MFKIKELQKRGSVRRQAMFIKYKKYKNSRCGLVAVIDEGMAVYIDDLPIPGVSGDLQRT
jgi:hypothetical protein